MSTHAHEIPDIQKHHISEGFTLIEIMIALLIIGGVIAGSVYMATSYLESSRRSTTETTLQHLKTNILLYQGATGEYPNTLVDLVKQPQGIKNWRQFLDKEPKDGWGHKFAYRRTPEGEHPYELYSYGGSKGKKESKSKRVDAWQL